MFVYSIYIYAIIATNNKNIIAVIKTDKTIFINVPLYCYCVIVCLLPLK